MNQKEETMTYPYEEGHQATVEEFQQYHANALKTWWNALGQNKTAQNKRVLGIYEAKLKELGSAPDPKLEGQFNGKGAI